MKKPRALKKGSTIGLIAPSSPVKNISIVYKAIKILEGQGFNVVTGESISKRYGYLSGEDYIRANDINNMFKDKNIDGIFCLRGGYGVPRILDKLDYNLIKNNPKLFIGYSDITALHIVLNQRCDIITFHGPMVASDMIDDFDEFSKQSYFRAITSVESLGEIKNPEGIPIKSMVKGKAFGKIIGGNLSLIAATLGTPYEINTKGKILFLEDIDECTYSIDRMLTQLRLAGKLNDCRGIILGDFKNCNLQREDDLTLMEVFNDIIKESGKPTIYNFKAGHCKPKVTLPLGVKAYIDADECTIKVLENALI
jgi:muramoyltetrapeptide carboxypeptidase